MRDFILPPMTGLLDFLFRVISSEGSLAHPAMMYDCAGELLVGKTQQAFGVGVASVFLLLSSLALP